MHPGEYALGIALATFFVLSASWCGIVLRRLLVPRWSGTQSVLATSILSLSVFLVLCEALGSVGLFRRWVLAFAFSLAACAALLVYKRVHNHYQVRPASLAARISATEAALLAGVGVLVFTPFVTRIAAVYRTGIMPEWDTNWYHAPIAARFMQTGDLTRLQYVNDPSHTYLPFNAELIHAGGMLATGTDVLSPLINLGWALLALLAAWCLGSVWRVGAPAVAAVALVISTPVLLAASAGIAGNDLAALALLLAAVALITRAPSSRGAVTVAGLAAGLAVGTKLTLVAPILILSGLLAVTWIGRRTPRLAALWGCGVLLGGGFWYLRNAVLAHNPFPWFKLGIGPLALTSSAGPPRDCGGTTVAQYLTNTHVVGHVFVPSLAHEFGPRGLLLIVLAAAGTIFVTLRGGMTRLLGAVALTAAFAYLITPGAAGHTWMSPHVPDCFGESTRFATPALALGLVLVPIAACRWRRLSPLVLGSLLAVLLATNVPLIPVTMVAALAAALAAAALMRFATTRPHRRPSLRMLIALAVPAVLAAAAIGWPVQVHYFQHRSAANTLPEPIEQSVLYLRNKHHLRIAVGGFNTSYALYGADLSNWVEYPALRGPPGSFQEITSCEAWQKALSLGRYDYVVTYNSYGRRPPPEAEWTRFYPGASLVLHHGINELFKLGRRSITSSSHCPRG